MSSITDVNQGQACLSASAPGRDIPNDIGSLPLPLVADSHVLTRGLFIYSVFIQVETSHNDRMSDKKKKWQNHDFYFHHHQAPLSTVYKYTFQDIFFNLVNLFCKLKQKLMLSYKCVAFINGLHCVNFPVSLG